MFILFKAHLKKIWSGMMRTGGQFRFLQRIWRLADAALGGLSLAEGAGSAAAVAEALASGAALSPADQELRRAVHTAIHEVTEDLDGDVQFNTAVSELMKLSNAMVAHLAGSADVFACEALRTLLILLALLLLTWPRSSG